MPKVSVIVPIYNAEKLLFRSVESVLRQSMPDWELLLVNDGSTDGSLAVCREYEKNDARIRVTDKPNGGVSSARNAGLDAAAGEYIAFLDSDDCYEPDALENLLREAERADASVVIGSVKEVFPDKGNAEKDIFFSPCVMTETKDILHQFLLDPNGLFVCWNKLYRRELIGDLRFESLTIGEDALFVTELLKRCTRCAVSDALVTHYYIYNGSSMHREFSLRRLDHLTAWLRIYECVSGVSGELSRYAAMRVVHIADIFYKKCSALPKEERKSTRKMLVRTHRKYYFRQYKAVSLRRRVAAGIFRISPRLYFAFAVRL